MPAGAKFPLQCKKGLKKCIAKGFGGDRKAPEKLRINAL